jgi:hypothetical protein
MLFIGIIIGIFIVKAAYGIRYYFFFSRDKEFGK